MSSTATTSTAPKDSKEHLKTAGEETTTETSPAKTENQKEVYTMTKKATIQMYREKLATDARWAIRGLMRIYQEQTPTEQDLEVTAYHNGVGFSGVDAEILTSFAKQYERKGSLSEKQMALLFKKMPRYSTQLYELANQPERRVRSAA